MQSVKKASEYTVFKKRSGRFAVINKSNQFIKGEEKVKILLKEGFIKLSQAKKKEEAPAEEAAQA